MSGYNYKPIDVFLSYSYDDDDTANDIKLLLKQFGVHAFKADRDMSNSDLRIGENPLKALSETIPQHDVFIVLVSKNYKEGDSTDQEFGICYAQNKKIIPFLLDNTEPYGFMISSQGKKYEQYDYDNRHKRRMDIANVVNEIIEYKEQTVDLFRFIAYRYIHNENIADAIFYERKFQKSLQERSLEERFENNNLIKKYVDDVVDAVLKNNSQIVPEDTSIDYVNTFLPVFLKKYESMIDTNKKSREDIQRYLNNGAVE